LRLVKIHFWMHNFGLIGMVVFFLSAGLVGGLDTGEDAEKLISHLLAFCRHIWNAGTLGQYHLGV